MNRKISGLICALTLIGVWAYVQAQTPLPSPISKASPASEVSGRYKVIQIDLDMPAWGDDNPKERTAMKIDTQTGRTWLLTQYKDANGTPHLAWVEHSDITK